MAASRPHEPPSVAMPAAAAADTTSGVGSSTIALAPPPPPKSGKLRKKLELSVAFIREWWRARCLELRPKKDCPSPVAFPAEGSEAEPGKETRVREIKFIVTIKRGNDTEDIHLVIANASFDFNFTEELGMTPVILVNRSLLQGREDDGFFEKYDDPENPPVDIRNADNTKMKLYGEFSAKWSPCGSILKYVGQQIFLNPQKSIVSRCLVVSEESRFDVLVGLGTIEEHELDKPVTSVAMTKTQVGRHDKTPSIRREAVEKQRPILEADKQYQARIQNEIEKKKTGEKKKARMVHNAKKK